MHPLNEAAYVVWSVTEEDGLGQRCLANHKCESAAMHRYSTVWDRVPSETRAMLEKHEETYIGKQQTAYDSWKGTDMTPPTGEFDDQRTYVCVEH